MLLTSLTSLTSNLRGLFLRIIHLFLQALFGYCIVCPFRGTRSPCFHAIKMKLYELEFFSSCRTVTVFSVQSASHTCKNMAPPLHLFSIHPMQCAYQRFCVILQFYYLNWFESNILHSSSVLSMAKLKNGCYNSADLKLPSGEFMEEATVKIKN